MRGYAGCIRHQNLIYCLNTRFTTVDAVRNSITLLSSLCGANIVADPLPCYKAQMVNLVLIRLFMNSNLYMSVELFHAGPKKQPAAIPQYCIRYRISLVTGWFTVG